MSIVEPPSYEQLALLVVELTGRLDQATTRLDEAAARIAALEAEVAGVAGPVGKGLDELLDAAVGGSAGGEGEA